MSQPAQPASGVGSSEGGRDIEAMLVAMAKRLERMEEWQRDGRGGSDSGAERAPHERTSAAAAIAASPIPVRKETPLGFKLSTLGAAAARKPIRRELGTDWVPVEAPLVRLLLANAPESASPIAASALPATIRRILVLIQRQAANFTAAADWAPAATLPLSAPATVYTNGRLIFPKNDAFGTYFELAAVFPGPQFSFEADPPSATRANAMMEFATAGQCSQEAYDKWSLLLYRVEDQIKRGFMALPEEWRRAVGEKMEAAAEAVAGALRMADEVNPVFTCVPTVDGELRPGDGWAPRFQRAIRNFGVRASRFPQSRENELPLKLAADMILGPILLQQEVAWRRAGLGRLVDNLLPIILGQRAPPVVAVHGAPTRAAGPQDRDDPPKKSDVDGGSGGQGGRK